jgi:hypothetical protein
MYWSCCQSLRGRRAAINTPYGELNLARSMRGYCTSAVRICASFRIVIVVSAHPILEGSRMRWLLSLFLVGLLAQQAVGQVTDVTWNPTGPVIGEQVTFWTVGQAPYGYFASTKWESRYAASQPPEYGGEHELLGWTLLSDFGAGSVQIYFYVPLNFQVKATVRYTSWTIPKGPDINDTVIHKTISIPVPDNLETLSGLNAPSLLNQPISIQYRIRSGTKAIGLMSNGYVQYLYINRWCYWFPNYPDDEWNWHGDGLSRYGCMLYSTTALVFEDQIAVLNVPPGDAFVRATKPFRYIWQTPYGEPAWSSLGSKSWNLYRYGAEQWVIKEQ